MVEKDLSNCKEFGGSFILKNKDISVEIEYLCFDENTDVIFEGKAVEEQALANDKIKSQFEKYIPNYDKERVYVSDMKKLFTWYNLLVGTPSFKFEAKTAEA